MIVEKILESRKPESEKRGQKTDIGSRRKVNLFWVSRVFMLVKKLYNRRSRKLCRIILTNHIKLCKKT